MTLLPDDEEYDFLNVLVALALMFGLMAVYGLGIARGDERRRRFSFEEPEPDTTPVAPAKPAASPERAAKAQEPASAARDGGVPADTRPLVIVYTVPLQCAPCRRFDEWAEEHAARSPFRFEAREYRRFSDLPARIGTVPQFDFQGADGKRKQVNGWTGSLTPIVAEYMRHNPEWKPVTRTKRRDK